MIINAIDIPSISSHFSKLNIAKMPRSMVNSYAVPADGRLQQSKNALILTPDYDSFD